MGFSLDTAEKLLQLGRSVPDSGLSIFLLSTLASSLSIDSVVTGRVYGQRKVGDVMWDICHRLGTVVV